MIVAYDYKLVLLSVAVAIVSAYAGLLLLNSEGGRSPLTYKARVGFAAFIIGTGIWSMHFIGMLALHLPIPVDYAVFQTLLSVLIAIALTGVGLYAATSGHLGQYGCAAGATCWTSPSTCVRQAGSAARSRSRTSMTGWWSRYLRNSSDARPSTCKMPRAS